MAMSVLRAAFPDVSYKRYIICRVLLFSVCNHGWKRGKVTLKKKAADEQFFPATSGSEHTRQNLLTHREKHKNGRHLYAHEPHILLRIFIFIVKNKQKSARFLTPFFPLVWILRLCNLLIFFFKYEYTPPTDKCSTLSGDAWLSVSREWNGKTRHIMMKSPGGVDRIKSNPDFKVCLHFSRSITHTNSAGYCVGHSAHTHTHSRSILFCWALVSNGNRRINAAFNLCHFLKK